MDMLTDLFSVQTPRAPDSLKLVRVRGEAAGSKCVDYTLKLRTGLTIIDVDQLLYQPVTISMAEGARHLCYLNGLAVSITQKPSTSTGSTLLTSQGYWDYKIVNVPKLQFLDQAHDCRFFENRSAVDIAQIALPEFEVTDVDYRISGSVPTRPYTVMFNESYLGFLNRILAQDGLFYFLNIATARIRW